MKRNLLYSALALISVLSCSKNKQVASDEENDRNIQMIRKLYGHFNKHEWKEMAELYSDSAEFKDPAFGTGAVKQSRRQVEQHYADLEKMFPDIQDTIVSVYNSGKSNVIVEFVSFGTAADHTKIRLPICTIFTIQNGLITKDYTYYNEPKP